MADLFTPRYLSETINQLPAARTPLRDLVFSKKRTATAETVDFEIITATQKLAKFRARGREAAVVDKRGRKIVTFRIPSIREKEEFKAEHFLNTTAPGTGIYTNQADINKMAENKAAEELQELRNRIARTNEWLAAQALTGSISISLDDYDVAIDFGFADTHKPVLTSTAKWDASADVDIPAALRSWRRLIAKDSGYQADVVIMGSDAADKFLANNKVQKLLDNKNIVAGKLDLAGSNPDYIGSFLGFDFFENSGGYVDDTDTAQSYLASDKVVVVARDAPFHWWNGPVDDLDANFGVMEFFSKKFRVPDPSVDWLLVASAPLPVVHHAGAIVYADVM